MANKRLIEMTDILTSKALEDLKVGQVLTFMYEGSPAHYKIARIKDGRMWVKQVTLYDPDEVKIVDKETGKEVDL